MKKRRVASNKRILILCEGMTEEIYSKALRTAFLPRALQRTVSIDVVRHKKNDPMNLVAEAQQRVKVATRARMPYSDVWLFFDDDNSPHLSKVLKEIENNSFRLAFTSICIEYWFILHFEDCGRAFATGEDCGRYLQKLWTAYHKTKINHFVELGSYLENAIQHAELQEKRNAEISVLDAKPYTSVHKLVEFFRDLGRGS